METNAFDNDLRLLALSNTPPALAHCGDIVTTIWGDWKHEHRVMISEIGVQIVSLEGRRPRRDHETREDYLISVPIMGVEYYYFALRLDRNDVPKEKYGIALTNFRTDSGQIWTKKHRDFNHVGLAFAIDIIPEEERNNYAKHRTND